MALRRKKLKRGSALGEKQFKKLEAEVFLFGWDGCDEDTWASLTKQQQKILKDHRCDPRTRPTSLPILERPSGPVKAAPQVPGTVGVYVRLARERQQRDLENQGALGLWFDGKLADRAVYFFRRFLRHSKGAYAQKPFELEPWQEHDIIRPLFGWRRVVEGLPPWEWPRRYRKAYLEVARKNGKSTLGAGIGNLLTFADGEQGAEVYSAATKRDQAKIVHSEAVRMVKASPDLKANAYTILNNISVPRSNSKYEPLGADADTLDGLNVSGCIIDEVHAHKTRDVVDKIVTGTGSRWQPLVVMITTAGVYDKTSICWEQHQYGIDILEGHKKDETFFVYIATLDEEDDWMDEKVWPKANPNLGVSVSLEGLRADIKEAREKPAAQNNIRRYKLNQWTAQVNRWLMMDKWDACAGQVDEDELKGKPCIAALDLASKKDLTGLALIFPTFPKVKVLFRAFVPREGMLRRVKLDQVPYDAWERDGQLIATEGNVTDYGVIKACLAGFSKRYDLRRLYFDPWNASHLINEIQQETGIECVEVAQTYNGLSEASKLLEALLLGEDIEHGGHPVARWCAGNVAIETDGQENYKPSKKKAKEKIDLIVALIMALRGITDNVIEGSKSPYDKHGVRFL